MGLRTCPGYFHCRIEAATACLERPPPVAVPCLREASEAAVRAAGLTLHDDQERQTIVAEVMGRAGGRGRASAIFRTRPALRLQTLLVSIARNVWRERARASRRASRGGPRSLDPIALDAHADPRGRDPASYAAARDRLIRLRALAGRRLPPPCREIAIRLLNGDKPHEICPFLMAWRYVEKHECNRLIRLAIAMLRALEPGQDVRVLWPNGWDRDRNPWFQVPPPPNSH